MDLESQKTLPEKDVEAPQLCPIAAAMRANQL
jgi:hypothetical protein